MVRYRKNRRVRIGGRDMTDDEIKKYIDIAIKRTISEYKKSGILKESDGAAYSDASQLLHNYFDNGEKDTAITYALQGIRFDPYFRIIPEYYKEHKQLEKIADELRADVSTVVRNKKRLCLEVYNEII